MTRLVVALVGLAAISGLGATAGEAEARPFELGITDPVFTSPDSAERNLWLDRAVASNATNVLPAAVWAAIAPASPSSSFDPTDPTDPEYDFATLDAAVRSAIAHGLDPMVLVTGAPFWAEGKHRPTDTAKFPLGTWKPQPAELRKFAIALARRYSGSFNDPADTAGVLPRVRDYQLWAEPNLSIYLNPQWRRGKPAAPSHYRKMLRAFYKGIHSASKSNRVVTGGTSPYGKPHPGGPRLQPALFWREVLCLRGARLKKQPCRKPAKFDVLAHNPINVGAPTREALNDDDVSTPDIGKLRRILNKARASGRVLPKGDKPIWATEIWWDSKPPDPKGVPERRHARWLAKSFYVLWKQRVERVIWFPIKDAPSGGNFAATPQSGLYRRDGRAKLAQRAFRFPFVAEQTKGRRIRVWGVAPSRASVSIELKKGSQWKPLGAIRAKRSHVFADFVRAERESILRARQGPTTSVPFKAK